MADFAAITIYHVSELGFYIILSTLEPFKPWNLIVFTKKHERVKQ